MCTNCHVFVFCLRFLSSLFLPRQKQCEYIHTSIDRRGRNKDGEDSEKDHQRQKHRVRNSGIGLGLGFRSGLGLGLGLVRYGNKKVLKETGEFKQTKEGSSIEAKVLLLLR